MPSVTATRRVIAISFLVAAVLGTAVPAASAEAVVSRQPRGTSSTTAVPVPAAMVAEARAAVDAITRFGGSPATFDAAAAMAAGVPRAIVEGIQAGAQPQTIAAVARCVGRNGIRYYSSWWQGRVTVYMLNSCNANAIAGLLTAGSGVAALVSVLIAAGIVTAPGAVATAIASAIMAVGAGAIIFCTRNGTGLEVHKAYYGVWCTNQ